MQKVVHDFPHVQWKSPTPTSIVLRGATDVEADVIRAQLEQDKVEVLTGGHAAPTVVKVNGVVPDGEVFRASY